ncbi:RelA/SpoT family protein [Desulfobacter vibrioformis]|uniref:RelA/SpoT family protein n=1 Tax=Desulfobacter vibrioformis TaxID=34031 RepID=UPI000557B7B5|nr:bifunctional (p)ppGpp synthetase/guanosine-3',5'-bis(diphosphate) 3'-pyrophosphohydrolase [Desulfobacter vibrioformis]
MIRITDILDKIYEYSPDADVSLIDRAYIYSAQVHDGQVRLSGEPYLSHPLEVANILADMKLDMESIAAALLHDVIEDTPATKEDITHMFGPGVAHIVEGVTKLSALHAATKVAQQAESLRKMILAMADDIRVVLIKLADRLHNMRTLKYHKKPEKQAAIAQETLDIYAPIAARLGIFWIKNELEEIAFFYTLREEHDRILTLVNKAKDEQEAYIKEVSTSLHYKMEEMNLPCQIKGRFKSFYSIYQKMLSQGLEFDEVYDIIAFRIILDTIPQCYAAMGAVHSMWKPIYYKIKDYIGNPKPNMYQSIHTTVIGPKGERVEIQIRTHDMDRVAESGIAAHWSYKEGTRIDENTGELFAWIRNLVENQENLKDPDEFLENVRIDLYPGEIYVFTPAGEIKTLPKKATPVDFAYRIHTEVGAQCTGARVNGKLVPLSHELRTGNTVEIITTKGHHPNRDWLNFVKTVKAKTKIRAYINAREKERSYSLGREMCEKTFKKRSQNFNALIKSGDIGRVAESYGFKTVDDLIAHVGFGQLTALQVLNRAVPELEKEKDSENADDALIEKTVSRPLDKRATGVIVKGLNDILVKFSKCCTPLPEDPIIGYITQGQGVAIHRKNCINILKMSSERVIDVEWASGIKESYPASICIKTDDRHGLLADIAAVISKAGINILNAHSETSDEGIGVFYFTIMVESSGQLNKVMAELRRVKTVNDVKRVVLTEEK